MAGVIVRQGNSQIRELPQAAARQPRIERTLPHGVRRDAIRLEPPRGGVGRAVESTRYHEESPVYTVYMFGHLSRRAALTLLGHSVDADCRAPASLEQSFRRAWSSARQRAPADIALRTGRWTGGRAFARRWIRMMWEGEGPERQEHHPISAGLQPTSQPPKDRHQVPPAGCWGLVRIHPGSSDTALGATVGCAWLCDGALLAGCFVLSHIYDTIYVVISWTAKYMQQSLMH